MKLLWAQYMCINFTWPFYITWLPTYLQEARGLTVGKSARLSGLPLFFGGIGCLLAGLIAKRLVRRYDVGFARRLMPMIGCTCAAIFLLIFPAIPNPYLAMVVLAMASFSNDLLMPSAWATCMDIGGKHAGIVSGSMNMMGNLFAALSAPTVGYILVAPTATGTSSSTSAPASTCWPRCPGRISIRASGWTALRRGQRAGPGVVLTFAGA